MTMDKLRLALLAASWNVSERIYGSDGNECTWYAWATREMRKTPTDCACNEKPPSIIIEPSKFGISGKVFESVTFKLCGELPNGRWVAFQVYSVGIDECMQEIEGAKVVLLASWEAACGVSLVNMED